MNYFCANFSPSEPVWTLGGASPPPPGCAFISGKNSFPSPFSVLSHSPHTSAVVVTLGEKISKYLALCARFKSVGELKLVLDGVRVHDNKPHTRRSDFQCLFGWFSCRLGFGDYDVITSIVQWYQVSGRRCFFLICGFVLESADHMT